MKALPEYVTFTRRNSFSFLLVSLLTLLLIPAFFEETGWEPIVTHVALTLVLLSCLWVIFGVSRHPLQPILAGLLVIGLNWVAFFDASNGSTLGTRLMAFLIFWSYTTYRILTRINRMKSVNADVIAGAVSGYLLFGIIGGLIAAWLELVSPGSFSTPGTADLSTFIYYSFITLSTLGYGDIVPKTEVARTLSIAITLTGQIYLTIVIAILVGKFITRSD